MDQVRKAQIICDDCEALLPYTHFSSIKENLIQKIFWGRVPVDNAIAILFFTKESIVQKIIFELKYKQNKKAGYLLGRLIAIELLQNDSFFSIDYLIPIPISKRTMKKRGFNQSMIICEAIVSNGYNKPIFLGLLKNKNHTTQTHKDRLERAMQPNVVFSLSQKETLKGKHLLVIDDVITTGATIENACLCLMQSHPVSIQVASAAYTYH